jgi:Na+/H+ antiporter NhaD/arsenite permease-like protein
MDASGLVRSARKWGGSVKPFVLVVFAMVYAGMILGELPRLALDRTGVALLGAIALLAGGAITLAQAGAAVDVPTLALLVAVTGLLSAVFTNDVVCLAMAPVWIDACARRRLDPVPFLLALACAANVGSAATLIGNPQNILIGQTLALSFNGYLGYAALPTAYGLVVVWVVVAFQQRGNWGASRVAAGGAPREDEEIARFDAWQTAKGLAVAVALLVVFVATPWPREVAALGAAGVLLLSRRLHSRDKLGLVDWPLLVLFLGLFVVNGALAETGVAAAAVAALRDRGVDLAQSGWLLAATVALSNLVSNVPAVMLLLPHAQGPTGGPLLALASTLAGNLVLVGSILLWGRS